MAQPRNDPESTRYHHGELRATLLEAAERELIEKGEEGFSLRSTARRAGVSHAAPAHHFKNATALLHGLAQVGFERLTATMKDEQRRALRDDQVAQFAALGVGYVRFAMENADLFRLMFGGRLTGTLPPELAKAADGAFSVLVNGVAKLRGADALSSEAGWRDITGAWSIVHGYAHLAISGKMSWAAGQPFDAQRSVIDDMVRRAMRL